MEDKTEVVISFGSRNSNSRHVCVTGLTQDQEDDLFMAVEEVYRERLMTDCMLTCEFWIPEFALEEVCMVVQAKLSEMQICFSVVETATRKPA